jgi:hypothetical protein
VRNGQVQDKDWGVQELGAEMLRERSDRLAEGFRAEEA